MIQSGDRVMVCVSGGKDSFTMLRILSLLRRRAHCKFELFAFTLDQAQPGWDDSRLRQWFEDAKVPYEILTRDTYSIVKDKIPEGNTYCSLCSRLRRGIIYTYAEANGFNKVALGHHRDDLIRTLLMSILYSGEIKSMPPKLLSNNKNGVAQEMLALLTKNLPHEYADIKDAYETKNFSLLLQRIHKLHGAVCYVGVPRLKHIIAKFESALKNKLLNDIPELFSQFDIAVNEVLTLSSEHV